VASPADTAFRRQSFVGLLGHFGLCIVMGDRGSGNQLAFLRRRVGAADQRWRHARRCASVNDSLGAEVVNGLTPSRVQWGWG
jgi:hypothetical protein